MIRPRLRAIIGRATARINVTPALALQSGGEATYNVLQGHSAYSANGVAIALPNEDPRLAVDGVHVRPAGLRHEVDDPGQPADRQPDGPAPGVGIVLGWMPACA